MTLSHIPVLWLVRMIEALGATSNVMALILVNMIGYAVGIKGAGHVAGGIFLEREGLIAVALSFMFVFSGVQASGNSKQQGRSPLQHLATKKYRAQISHPTEELNQNYSLRGTGTVKIPH